MRGPWGILVVVALLSGCSNAADRPVDEAPQEDLPQDPAYEPQYKSRTGGFVNGTEAAYYCDTIANSTVQVDVNKTLDGGAHSHDMWKGQDSMVIFEAEIEDFVTTVQTGETITAATWFVTPGAVVHPGAGRATFKLEWDTDAIDHRELGVLLPITQRESVDRFSDYVLKFTESGQEHSIDFSFEDNDPPHSEKTFWRFKLHHGNAATDAGGRDALKDLAYQTAFVGLREAKFTWTIHRTYDCLPVDPPHYDFWDGRNEALVFETATEHDTTATPLTSQGRFPGFQFGCYGRGGCGLPDDGTIPPGTGTLRVEMTWDNQEAVPATLGLEWVGADQNFSLSHAVWQRPEPVVDEAGHRVWEIDVHPLQADSPYAQHSRWDFRWYFDRLGVDDIDDIGRFRGTVEWKVEAFKAGYGP